VSASENQLLGWGFLCYWQVDFKLYVYNCLQSACIAGGNWEIKTQTFWAIVLPAFNLNLMDLSLPKLITALPN